MAAFTPRVRPRVPLEALVDTTRHPPRKEIPTGDEADRRLHWTSILALVALVSFWVNLSLAGIVATFAWRGALAPLGIALSSLVVSYRIEAE